MSELIKMITLGKNIPLKSSRHTGGSGVSYTDRELKCARFITKLAFVAAKQDVNEGISDEEIESDPDKMLMYEVFKELCEVSFPDLKRFIRKAYRTFEDIMLVDDETIRDFPTCDVYGKRINRNPSSLTVLFRAAIKGLLEKEVIDQVFKIHQKKGS